MQEWTGRFHKIHTTKYNITLLYYGIKINNYTPPPSSAKHSLDFSLIFHSCIHETPHKKYITIHKTMKKYMYKFILQGKKWRKITQTPTKEIWVHQEIHWFTFEWIDNDKLKMMKKNEPKIVSNTRQHWICFDISVNNQTFSLCGLQFV